MRLGWVLVLALLCSPAAAPVAAQGVPGSQAFFAGRDGWQALRDGRNQDAADAFASAIAAEPRDPTFHFGAGVAAHLLGRPAAARESLGRALSLAPQLTDASLLLGDILYKASEVDAAIRIYEAALKYAPMHATLTARLEALRREASLGNGFFQAQGAHFTVLFEGPADEELARRAVEILEEAYWRVGAALSTYPEHLVTVVLYTQEQFRDITRSPQWAAAAYDGRIRVPVRGALADPAELERVLTHEYTHALLQTIAPRNIPTWLNEGLAVLFEPNGSTWLDGELARGRARIALQRLGAGFGTLSTAEARQAYVESGLAARALVEAIGVNGLLGLLKDLAEGTRFQTAFERHALMPLDAFQGALFNPR
jgi:tetratricopeptide (TPR) repeat protein